MLHRVFRLICGFYLCLIIAASKIAVVLNPPVSEQEVSIDDGFMITCMVTGWPDKATAAPNLRWIMSNGKPVTSKTTSDRVYVMPMENSLRVFVRNVQKEDSGQWKCELALQGGGKESVSILIKTWKKITFVDFKKLQEPKIGTDAIIECKVDALPTPKITWAYRGKLITAIGRYLILPEGLKIIGIKEEDNGLYTCMAEIPAKFIYEERIIEVRVTIPPEFPSPPSSRDDGVQGKDIKISCRATGKPPPIYTWSKMDGLNKVQLSNNDRITINNEEGTLEIKRLVPSDSGYYMCLASNTGGGVETNYELDVRVPAKITEVTSGKGTEDGQASISCVATGNEVPEIFFTKVGDPAPVTQTESYDRIQQRRTPGANSVKLELTILSLRVSDMTQYMCLAANKYGKDTRNVTLEVQFAPKFTKDTLKQTYTWAKSLKPMKCVVQANPPAVIKWKRNDQFLKNNDTYAIKTSDDREKYQMISLLTVKVELEDEEKFGDYFCEAKNTLGPAVSRTISLLEAKAPGKPAYVRVVETQPTCIRMVIYQPTNNGGMPVTKYHVEYNIPGTNMTIIVDINLEHRREDEPIPSTIAEVRDLKPSTLYRFEISAENEVGRGLPLVRSHTTKEIFPPKVMMKNQYSRNIGESVTFKCTTDQAWFVFYFKRHTEKPDKDQANFQNKFLPVIYDTVLGPYEIVTNDTFLKDRIRYIGPTRSGRVFKITIRDLDCSDAGFYQCHVTGKSEGKAETELIIKAPPMQPVIKPQVQIEHDLNARFSLTCEGNVGSPHGNLTWYRQLFGREQRDVVLPSNKTLRDAGCLGYKTSTINIIATADLNNAIYFCYASYGTLPTASQKVDKYIVRIKGMSTTPFPSRRKGGGGAGGGNIIHTYASLLTSMLIARSLLMAA